jgi:formate dehydrogenase major subunit
MDPKKVKTEVFLLPAACSVERDGSLTNSGRLVQWRYKAVEPPGDAIADGEMVNRLIVKLKELYKKEGGKYPDPILNLKWDYVDDKGKFDPHKMAKECNGYFLKDVSLKDPTGKDVTFKKGDLSRRSLPTGRGAPPCGNWPSVRSYTNGEHDGPLRKGRPHWPRDLFKLCLVLAG